MEARQQLGSYVLLKSLATDSFGESFRAGSLGAQGIERVVLLRVFNGPGVDGPAFWQDVADRQPIQSVLRSPHLAEGVDLGIDGDTPYVAYEYISGKSLAQLGRQAREKPFPIPVEHALYIVDRLAQALAAAHEVKFQGQRLFHGLLTPGWAWLSTEGEVRLQGVDIAPGLRSLPPQMLQSPDVRPYIAPEVLAGEPATADDDVYSLGSILFELLTGSALPDAGDQIQLAIENAVLAAEGTALPGSMRDLLANSLSQRGLRIDNAEKWRMVLAALVDEGDHSPSTFNMAFFLHTLFRTDIERESAEVEKEQTSEFVIEDLAAAGSAPAAAETAVLEEETDILAELAAAEPPLEPTAATASGRGVAGVAQASSNRGRRRKAVLTGVIAAAVLLAAAGAGYYYYFMRAPGAPQTAAPPPTTQALPAPTATDPGAEGGDAPLGGDTDIASAEMGTVAGAPVDPLASEAPPQTPEELESQVRNMVAQGVGEMEASLKAEYEDRLSTLRQQLDEARTASPSETQSEVAEQAAPSGGQPAAPAARSTDSAPGTADRTGPATKGNAPTSAEGQQEAAQPPAGQPAAASQTGGSAAASTPPAQEPEPEPEVKLGDLAMPGPGVLPPRMVKRPRPAYPPAARKFAMRAIVKLRVLVDENGRAVQVEQVSERAGFGFDEAAERAARAAEWKPATKDGVRVKIWVDLTIEFVP